MRSYLEILKAGPEMKGAVAVVIIFASLARAQEPTTEQEWRSEIQKVQREHREASSNMWGGVALGVGGVILAGFSSKQKCVIGNPTINACYGYGGYSDWRLLGPGLGLAGLGGVLAITSIGRQQQSAKRLKDLRSIGTQHGWTIVLNPTSLSVAYRW
jgi:hypothetical protein